MIVAWTRLLAVKWGRSGSFEQYCGDKNHSTLQMALDMRVRKRHRFGWKGWLAIEMNKIVSAF